MRIRVGRSVPKTHRMNALNTSLFLAALAVTPWPRNSCRRSHPTFT